MILEKIFNIVYPDVCGICGKIEKNSLCKKCKTKLNFDMHKDKYKDKFFSEHIYVTNYEGEFRKKLIEYKFYEQAYLYKFFAEIIIEIEKKYRFMKFYDIILSVPINRKKELKRGYNQSELIVEMLAKNTGLELAKNVLIKSKETKQQSLLSKEERATNIQGAYKLQDYNILKGKNVLLFDDIYTTGNTVNECCRTIKCANPGNIGVLTIAKD